MKCHSLHLELLHVDGWMNEQTNMAKLVGTFLHLPLTNIQKVESGVHSCVLHEVNCVTLAVLCILQSLLIHMNV